MYTGDRKIYQHVRIVHLIPRLITKFKIKPYPPKVIKMPHFFSLFTP